MLANNYEVYVTSNIKLVRSICIKSQQTIEAMNSYLQMLGIDMRTVPPTLWKYYVNLKGEYWNSTMISSVYKDITVADDVMMFFTTIEDNTTVPFTKQSLIDYPLSLVEFRRFEHYYQDMVKRYPEQEWLIRRIINPVEWESISILFTPIETGVPVELTKSSLSKYINSKNLLLEYGSYYDDLIAAYPTKQTYIDKIINSDEYSPLVGVSDFILMEDLLEMKDGTILFYDERLIESNEITLVQDIQKWIYSFNDRWNVTAFQNSDRLYPAAWLGLLKILLVPSLMNMRLERIKGNETHSFHIWTHLAGYFKLDRFKEALTKDQSLFLYRNIDKIVKTAGTKETQLFIYNNFIKNNGMILNTFEIRQDNSNFLELKKKEIIINKFPIDATNIVEYYDDVVNVEDFIEMLRTQATLNPLHLIEDAESLITKSLQTSSSNIATGVIECERARLVVDSMVSTIDEKMTQWFYLALNNKFNHHFNLSVFDEREVSISALQAIYLLWYCTDRYVKYRAHFFPNDPNVNNGTTVVDLTPDTDPLPDISVINILKNPNKTYQDFIDLGFIESRFITEDIVNVLNTNINLVDLVNIPVFNTVEDFSEYVKTVIVRKQILINIVNNETDIYGKSQLEEITTCEYLDLYQNYPATIASNWSEFFSLIDIDLSNVPLDSLVQISKDIVKHFIGNIEIKEGLPSPYYEMMQILRILSSYMVTYVPSDSSGIPKPIQWPKLHLKLKGFTMGYKYLIPVVPKVQFSYLITP